MPSPKEPNKYLGPNVYTNSVVIRNREPLLADFRQPETGNYYEIGCIWQVSKNPTTGTQGDLFMLSKIVANQGFWVQLASGVTPSSGILSVITNIPGPVLPDGDGDVFANTSTTTFTDGSTLNTLVTEVQAVTNGILYGQGTNVASATITPVIDGVLISSHTGIPSWLANGTPGQVLTANTNLPPSWQTNANGNVAGPGVSTDRAISTWNGITGDALFDNPSTRITAAGEMTNTLQPAFLGVLTVEDANVTGNAAFYTLGGGTALSEIFDQGSDFVTTGTFTAPVTGKYQLGTFITFSSLTAAMDAVTVNIITSNGVYPFGYCNVGAVRTSGGGAGADVVSLNGDVLADMDAADTFTVNTQILHGAGDTASVNGVGSRRVNMYGYLVC